MVYTITLNPALDYVMKTEALRFDDINRSAQEAIYYGGKGINVSVILTRLGIENTALGFIGGFTGKELEALLRTEGVHCDFNTLKNGVTRINVKIKTDFELDINAEGPPITEAELKALLAKLSGLEQGDYLILAGSVPKTLPPDTYEKILQSLEGKGINFIIDAAGDLLKNTLKYKPFLIKPNHHELDNLFGVTIQTEEEAERYAGELQKQGAKNVLVSLAENGAVLLDSNHHIHRIKNAKGTPVNSVGCGDSMVAGFLAGYIKSSDYSFALKLGTACGNATAFSEKLGEKAEIENIFAQLNNSENL